MTVNTGLCMIAVKLKDTYQLPMNGQDIKVIKVQPADLNALVALEQLSFESHNYPLSKRQFSHFINHGHVLFLVIKIKDELIGYALFLIRKNSSMTHLYSIAVHPKFRRLQLGKCLMEKAIAELHTMKLQRISLEVRIDNEAALNFYRQIGFKFLGKYVGYYADGTDAFRMEMRIESSPLFQRNDIMNSYGENKSYE